MSSGRIDPEAFYEELKYSGGEIRDLLWPLSALSPRERAVFTEYHYWNTHMRTIAESHRISLGRAYEILYRAEEKIAASRAQEEAQDAPRARGCEYGVGGGLDRVQDDKAVPSNGRAPR